MTDLRASSYEHVVSAQVSGRQQLDDVANMLHVNVLLLALGVGGLKESGVSKQRCSVKAEEKNEHLVVQGGVSVSLHSDSGLVLGQDLIYGQLEQLQ